MTLARTYQAWAACLASGLLLVLAFAPVQWSWCGWVALAPAWLALRALSQVQTQPLRYGYALGLVWVAGSFWWVTVASAVGFIIMLIGLSFYPALWFLLVARLLPVSTPSSGSRAVRIVLVTIAAMALWVTLEWLRDWFLTGFNWNNLGVSQTPHPAIRQLAALGGVPLLSFVVGLAGLLIAEAVLALLWVVSRDRFRQAQTFLLLAAVLPSAAWVYGWHYLQRHRGEVPEHVVRYACIQPNIPQIPYATGTRAEVGPLEENAYRVQEQLSALALPTQPDLLIWPEAIAALRLGTDPLAAEVIGDVQKHFTGDFLLGGEEVKGGNLYTCAYLAGPGGVAIQTYHKIHLVVLSEYPPLRDAIPHHLQYGFTAGERPAVFQLSQKRVTLSPFICFEETQPGLGNAAARLHPDFFVVLTNDDWFAGVPAHWTLSQQLQNGLLRTVEHDRPMLRCANNGISCEIDADGKVVAQLKDQLGKTCDVQGVFTGNLVLLPHNRTFYEQHGDWFLLLCKITTVLVGTWAIGKSRRTSFARV